MIDASYTVTCDGDPEHGCEAEFTYDAFGKVADLAGLVNQIEKRGWKRNGKRTICPLHDVGLADPFGNPDASPTEGNPE